MFWGLGFKHDWSTANTVLRQFIVAAIFDFSLPVWSHSVGYSTIRNPDPENIGAAVGILFLYFV